MSDKTITVHARIDQASFDKLKKIAESEHRSLSNLLRKILAEYLIKKP